MKQRATLNSVIGLWAYIAMATLTAGCNRVPDGVIKPEPMARLMADIRVADAVVSVNGNDYRNPAAREALKNAVFERHGVTEAMYDSSLVWYGHNIGRYQEVNDLTITILEERLARAGSAATAAAMSVAGDSVDIWDAARLYRIDATAPSRFITFAVEPDPNWVEGDVYTWHSRFIVQPQEARWGITAHYDDGVVETLQSTMIATSSSRQEIVFFTDSTRRAVHIGGWMEIVPRPGRPVVVDSVGLIRRRLYQPESGVRRVQRRIIPRKTDADTVR